MKQSRFCEMHRGPAPAVLGWEEQAKAVPRAEAMHSAARQCDLEIL